MVIEKGRILDFAALRSLGYAHASHAHIGEYDTKTNAVCRMNAGPGRVRTGSMIRPSSGADGHLQAYCPWVTKT